MKKLTESDCAGCRNNYYNQGNGVDGKCWSLKTATFKKVRMVSIHMLPPFDRVKPETKPSCYHKAQFVRLEVVTKPRAKRVPA